MNDSLVINTFYFLQPQPYTQLSWKLNGIFLISAPAVMQGNTIWQRTQFTLLPQARLPHQPRTTFYIRNPKWGFYKFSTKGLLKTLQLRSIPNTITQKKNLWKIVKSNFLKNTAVGKRTRSPQFWSGTISAPASLLRLGHLGSQFLPTRCLLCYFSEDTKSRLWHYLCSSHLQWKYRIWTTGFLCVVEIPLCFLFDALLNQRKKSWIWRVARKK